MGVLLGTRGGGAVVAGSSRLRRMREGGGWGKVCLLGFWNGELRGEGGGEGDVCEVALIGLLGRWVEVFGRGGDMVGEKSARV